MKIIVDVYDVWAVMNEMEESRDETEKLIAENKETGTEIYISVADGKRYVTVIMDDAIAFETTVINPNNCVGVITEVYNNYLESAAMLSTLEECEENDEEIDYDLICEREEELDDAVGYLLEVFVPNLYEMTDETEEICDGVKDILCEYLYKMGISVYRPMILEDEDGGNEEFTEYPYPELLSYA